MQTCRHFLGLTLANTQVICKEMNCNRATLHSSSSCSQAFQPAITASPTHSHAPQCSQPAWLRMSETVALYFSSRTRLFLQRAATEAVLQVKICSEGLSIVWWSATVLRALSWQPAEPTPHISCNGPKESSPEGNVPPSSLSSAPCGGAAIETIKALV